MSFWTLPTLFRPLIKCKTCVSNYTVDISTLVFNRQLKLNTSKTELLIFAATTSNLLLLLSSPSKERTVLFFQLPDKNLRVIFDSFLLQPVYNLSPALASSGSKYIHILTSSQHLHCCHLGPSCHHFLPGLLLRLPNRSPSFRPILTYPVFKMTCPFKE